ncbi:TnsA endonuclease N-terminal domain-containing protein [Paenibacillus prosopidis]|uniref:TnsA endonuclease-like protein n=1 Tax=Paenibacillus prosopidis TaxID=630520 RepID=A0A368VJF0_9BACL|nr:TnsA endonuclease N-terminal domain-containing protein [Paenibacillus prosopidis]RCW40583.1 TnsA endonuclease-like protein [Paenibacillus prosopidis]
MNTTYDAKYKPIVLPRNKKYGNNCWDAKGPKVGMRDIVLYSDLEFDHWLTIESDSNVLNYCEQPKKITYVLNGKLYSAIFDMWILYKDGTELFIEVKYEKELHHQHRKYERTKRQIEAQKEWCKQNSLRHEVRTEKSIRVGRHSIENKLKIISNVMNHKKPSCLSLITEQITTERRKLSEISKQLKGNVDTYEMILAVQ